MGAAGAPCQDSLWTQVCRSLMPCVAPKLHICGVQICLQECCLFIAASAYSTHVLADAPACQEPRMISSMYM